MSVPLTMAFTFVQKLAEKLTEPEVIDKDAKLRRQVHRCTTSSIAEIECYEIRIEWQKKT